MGLFNGKNEELEDLKRAMLRKFPSLGTTASGLKMKMTKSVPTAETDGETVFFNPDFLHGLTYDERVFTMSHETMHVAFKHIDRLQNSDGTMKDMGSWNEATDAVINQILQSEGLDIKPGMVNMPEAIDKSAEDMYKQIYEAKKARQQQQQQQQNQSRDQRQGQGQGQPQQQQQSGQSQQQNQSQQQQDPSGQQQQQQSSQSGEEQDQQRQQQEQQSQEQSQQDGQQNEQESSDSQQSQNGQQQQNGQSGQQQQNQSGQQGQSGQQDSQSGQQQDQGGQSGQQNGQSGQGSGSDSQSSNGNQGQNSQGENGQGNGQNTDNLTNQPKGGSGDQQENQDNAPKNHSMWEKAFEKHKKEEEKRQQEAEKKKQEQEKKKQEEKKKQQQEKKKQDQKPEENQDGENQDDQNGENDQDKSKYDLEKDNFQKQSMERNSPSDSQNNGEEQDSESEERKKQNEEMDKLEREFAELNKQLKKKLADKARKKIQDRTFDGGKGSENGGDVEGEFGELGEDKPIVSWKTLLKKAFEKTEYRWSYRRSNRDNGYSARIERLENYDQPATEVIVDTSGSINDALLRGFLRQVKALLKQAYGKEGGPKETKLSIGCFDDCFHGFTEIKTPEDIDHYRFVGRGGTNIDSAVRAFTKDKKVNKIIFTDGFDGYGFPHGDYKDVNCIYVIFDNPNFKAPNGKTIYVQSAEILKDSQQLITGKHNVNDDIELE